MPLAGHRSVDLILGERYVTALEYSGSNLIYLGQALAGSSKASAMWQIRKMTYDGSDNLTDIQFAGGSTDYTSVWNDRASLSYS